MSSAAAHAYHTVRAQVHGPALFVSNCSSWTEFKNYTKPLSEAESKIYNEEATGPLDRQVLYAASFVEQGPTVEHIAVHIVRSGDEVAEVRLALNSIVSSCANLNRHVKDRSTSPAAG